MPSQIKLTTGRLYWLPSGATDGYIDFGNVADYKQEPKIQRVDHMAANVGIKRADVSAIASHGQKKTFTLDEEFNQTILLLFLATQNANLVQTAIAGADSSFITSDSTEVTADATGTVLTATIAAPMTSRAYDLGRQGVTVAKVLDANNAAVFAGVGYNIDPGSGMLTVLQAAPAGPWTVTYTCLDVSDLSFTGLDNLFTAGTFKLIEYDQFDTVPYATETFTGQCYITAWGDNKGDKFSEFTLEVLITP